MPPIAFLALGSNLGNRQAMLDFALRELAATAGLRLIATTAPEETEPLGGLEQPDYLNAMVAVEAAMTSAELLDICQVIEHRAGRGEHQHWQSRELDIDIVRFGMEESEDPLLRLPHPGLEQRVFWQRQLAELEEVLDGR